MKKFKSLFVIAFMAAMLSSCNDAYNIEQEGQFTEDKVFVTTEDMNLALIELYDFVGNEAQIGFTSVFTDETAIGVENGGQNISLYRHQIFADDDNASAIWLNNYALINFANRIIEGSENVVVPAGLTEEEAQDWLAEKNGILAEVRALRAYAHFELMCYFSKDLTSDSELGVILLDHVPPVLPEREYLPRSTNGELFTFINSDLDYADEFLIAGNPSSLVTNTFVTGLRARMALYRGRNQEALDFAQAVINTTTGSNQGLTTRANYAAIWTNASTGENIFALERPRSKTGIVSTWFFNSATRGGGPFMEVSRDLYNELIATPGDIRTGVIVGPTSEISENYANVVDYRNEDVLVLGKYPGVTNLPLNNRVPVMRFSEIHLIKAEALAKLGRLEEARVALNFLRQRRFAPASPIGAANFDTDVEAFKAILDERRKELAFEGFRYLDLKRLGVLAGVTSVQRYSRDCQPYNACELSVTDYRFTLPIPIDEINGNPVISEQQNEGY